MNESATQVHPTNENQNFALTLPSPASSVEAATASAAVDSKPLVVVKAPLTPAEQAQMLKVQAQKARLEAERMDADLTLRKIND
jgi:hypothetical protein